jgi:hypothetical protein
VINNTKDFVLNRKEVKTFGQMIFEEMYEEAHFDLIDDSILEYRPP